MIILGVIVAVWLGERRWVARGGNPGTVVDIAVWAVPFGLVGGRLYHVITDYQLYFGKNGDPVGALEVWKGGLGIWGAVAAGALGAYLGCRRRGISLRTFADAAAPGIVLAQAIGRWGNWFNQELYGRPTKLPWALKIDAAHRPPNTPDIGTYHPTFLYESLWCIGVALLVIWAEKRFRLAWGRTFALYVAAYTVGRAWIEWLRVDSAHHILGLRLNDWTSLIVFIGAVTYLYLYRSRTEIPEGAVGTAVAETGDEPAAGEPREPAAPESEDARAVDAEAAADEDTTPARAAEPETDAVRSEDAEAAEGRDEAGEDAGPPTPDGPEPNGGAPDTVADDADEAGETDETDASQRADRGEGGGKEKASTGGEPGETKS
jgi:prolipoprotein diacylglyceryl transferase